MPPATVSVRDARAAAADRLWIQSVYRDYLDDLNPGTGLFPKLGEVGHREPDLIAHWFGDPNTFPLVIVKGSEPVGFARVVRIAATAAPPRLEYRMAEFFVARAAARGSRQRRRRRADSSRQALNSAQAVTSTATNPSCSTAFMPGCPGPRRLRASAPRDR